MTICGRALSTSAACQGVSVQGLASFLQLDDSIKCVRRFSFSMTSKWIHFRWCVDVARASLPRLWIWEAETRRLGAIIAVINWRSALRESQRLGTNICCYYLGTIWRVLSSSRAWLSRKIYEDHQALVIMFKLLPRYLAQPPTPSVLVDVDYRLQCPIDKSLLRYLSDLNISGRLHRIMMGKHNSI